MPELTRSAVLAVIFVSSVACHKHPPANDIHGVAVAAFDGGAIIATASASTHRYFLQRHNDDGTQRWNSGLDCEVSPLLIASADTVVASCRVHKETLISAYALQDGHEIWRYRSKYVTGGAMQPRSVDGAVVVVGENGILVLDQATGKLRLEYPTKLPVRGASIEGSRLAYGLPPRVLLVDATDGKQDSIERDGFGCMGHGRLWSKENGQLMASDASDLASDARHIEVNGTISSVIACGVYDGDAVLELAIDSNSETADHVVRLSPQDKVIWDVKLGDRVGPESRLSSDWREASGLNGELTRYSFALTHDQNGTHVVVLDLQTGTMRPTGRALSDRETVAMTVMKARGFWYVVDGDALAVYDGASGIAVGSGVFDGGGFLPLTPASVSSHGLWLVSGDWADVARDVFLSPELKKLGGNSQLRALARGSN